MYDEKLGVVFPQPLIWKDIKGFEGYYQVCNYGKARSLDRWISYESRGATVTRLFSGRELLPKLDKDGYFSFAIGKEQCKKYFRLHRMIAQTFTPHEDELNLVVDHIDGDVNNNCLWNLQWLTSGDNTIKYYAEQAGLVKSLSSLTKYEWSYIGYLYNSGLEYNVICENLGLGIKSPESIWDALSGNRLSSITGFKKGDFIKRKHPNTKLNPEIVCCIIKERLIDNVPLKKLSAKYDIAESMISRFCGGSRQPEGLVLFKEKYKV